MSSMSDIFLDAGRLVLVVDGADGELVVQRRRRRRPRQRAHRVRLVVGLVGGVEGAHGPRRDRPVPREERAVPVPVLDPLAPAVERLPHALRDQRLLELGSHLQVGPRNKGNGFSKSNYFSGFFC